MTKPVAVLLVAGCLFICVSPAVAQPFSVTDQANGPRITVYVYDYTQASPGTLERAEGEATYVFRQAGVEVTWHNCLAARPSPASDCNQVKGPTVFVLRVLRPSKTTRKAFGACTLGYSVRNLEGGALASLFYDRVEKVARTEGLSIGVVLGYAIAHELGHLLLLREGHTRDGLMRDGLTHQDWEQAARGTLLFTAEQAESIRGTVLAKLNQQEVTD